MKTLAAFFIPIEIVQDQEIEEVRQGKVTVRFIQGQPIEIINEYLSSRDFFVIQLSDAYTLVGEDKIALLHVLKLIQTSGSQIQYLIVTNSRNEVQGVIQNTGFKALVKTLTPSAVPKKDGKTYGFEPVGESSGTLPKVRMRAYICPNHPKVAPYYAYQNGIDVPSCPIGGEERILRDDSAINSQRVGKGKKLNLFGRFRKFIFGV